MLCSLVVDNESIAESMLIAFCHSTENFHFEFSAREIIVNFLPFFLSFQLFCFLITWLDELRIFIHFTRAREPTLSRRGPRLQKKRGTQIRNEEFFFSYLVKDLSIRLGLRLAVPSLRHNKTPEPDRDDWMEYVKESSYIH
jgi:hypothetical protein